MIEVMLVIVPIIGIAIFAFGLAVFVSPKFRGKFFSSHVKSMRYMVDESKDDIEHVSTIMAEASAKGTKIRTKAAAEGLKEGLTGEETIYCKHCGEIIDADSTFCKKCSLRVNKNIEIIKSV